MRHCPVVSRITTLSAPLSDEEWKKVIQGKADIFEHFGPWRVYSSLFCTFGLENNIRGQVWCKLLQIETLKNTFVEGLYRRLLALDATELEKIINNDHIATRSTLMESFGKRSKTNTYFTAC